MLRYFAWIFTVPLAVLAVLFAVSNREPLTFTLWPFDFIQVEMPLFLPILAALAVGFLAGSFFTWNRQRKYRTLAKQEAKEIKKLNQDLEKTQSEVEEQKKQLQQQPEVTALPKSS